MTSSELQRIQPPSQPGTRVRRVGKRGITRSGSALCGVVGFEQHLGLWSALIGGVGWLIALDHGGYFLRRRYGARTKVRLSGWQPTRPGARLLRALLHRLIGDPRAIRTISYPRFAFIHAASALVWGSVFVGVGYVLAARWSGGGFSWTCPWIFVVAAGLIFAIALTTRHRWHTAGGGLEWTDNIRSGRQRHR